MPRPPKSIVVAQAAVFGADGVQPAVAWLEPQAEERSIAYLPLGSGDSATPEAAGLRLVRTVPLVYGARTKPLAYHEPLARMDDQDVTALLMDLAEADDSLLGCPLPQAACDWSRLGNGEVAVTDLARVAVDDAVTKVRTWLGAPVPVAVETRLRALLRFHLAQRAPADQTAAALLAISGQGFAIGLWSPQLGLIKELEEPFELDAPSAEAGGLQQSRQSAICDAFISHAVGRLLALAREAGPQGFPPPACLLFAASAELQAQVHAEVLAQASGFQLSPSDLPLEDAVAQGLALAEACVPPPPLDLATPLPARLQAGEAAAAESARLASDRRWASLLVAAATPWAVTAALLVGAFGFEVARFSQTRSQLSSAEREAAQLRPIAAERRAAVENVRWFQTVIDQILDRRGHQSGSVRLLEDLNARWPAGDASFYVRELTLTEGGNLELKGLTRQEQSVTAFARALEFSGDLFENVGTTIVSGIGSQPSAGNQVAATQFAPGVTAWTIKALYTPMARPLTKGATR